MIFAVRAIPNWMTIGRILLTPVVAALIWIDRPDFGYALALALFVSQPAIDGIDAAILRSVFILLAALTVPHMLLVDMLFRPHFVAKHSS